MNAPGASRGKAAGRGGGRALGALALSGALGFAACGDASRSDEPAQAAFDAAADAAGRGPYDALQVETDLMVEMRDGIRLATDVYRPSREYEPVDEPFPVLLHRTPYDKTSRGLVDQARWFTTHGYVVVVQDTRGLYASEGTFQKYHEFDAPDGYDTIEWITGLEYAEPSVGMWGTSYGAHTQADAAKLNPPGLRDARPHDGGAVGRLDAQGAQPRRPRTRSAAGVGPTSSSRPWRTTRRSVSVSPEEPPSDWFPDTPFRKGENPLSVAPNFEDYYLTMQNHGDYDDYFRGIGRNWVEYYDETSDVPMLHVGGWYDSYAPGTIQSFVELSRRKSSPMTLLMGPWTHGGNSRSHAGDIEFGAEAAVEDFSREFHLRWFDRHLRGQRGNDLFEGDDWLAGEAAGPVTIFVMGGGDGRRDGNGRLFHGGEWRTAQAWPLADTETTPFYLRCGRRTYERSAGPRRRVDRLHLRSRAPGAHDRRGLLRRAEAGRLRPARSAPSGRSREARGTASSPPRWTAAAPPSGRTFSCSRRNPSPRTWRSSARSRSPCGPHRAPRTPTSRPSSSTSILPTRTIRRDSISISPTGYSEPATGIRGRRRR